MHPRRRRACVLVPSSPRHRTDHRVCAWVEAVATRWSMFERLVRPRLDDGGLVHIQGAAANNSRTARHGTASEHGQRTHSAVHRDRGCQ